MPGKLAQDLDWTFDVLLVEDDAEALEELADIVTLEGWRSHVARSVQEALDLLTSHPEITVIVTDVHLVEANGKTANGIDLISHTQALFPARNLSFVVLSGDPNSLGSSVQSGAVDFLSKPLVDSELIAAIHAAWDSRGRKRSRTELTDFLVEKMQKATAALQEANEQIAQHEVEDSYRRDEDLRQFKADMVRRALNQGAVAPWFEAQIDPKTGDIAGFEPVIRWADSDGTWQSAEEFLENADVSGTRAELDAALRSESLRAMSYFARNGLTGAKITFKASSTLLKTEGSIERILREAELVGLDPNDICFEIPEGPPQNKKAVVENLALMPNRTLRVKIETEMTAFSNLTMLPGMDVQSANIDISGVASFKRNTSDQEIAEALLSLAKAMGIQVIVSGIKTPFELDWAKRQNVFLVQGPEIVPALPSHDALAWAVTQHNERAI